MSNSTDYFINAKQGIDIDSLADQIKMLTCRTDFDAPGFALVRLPEATSSLMQRTLMVSLKERLSNLLFEERGTRLGWFNMTRFDQKVTTKPHRDGAPAESLLILGYEKT